MLDQVDDFLSNQPHLLLNIDSRSKSSVLSMSSLISVLIYGSTFNYVAKTDWATPTAKIRFFMDFIVYYDKLFLHGYL